MANLYTGVWGCERLIEGQSQCGERARRYLNGWYCPSHTPAALAGRPEANPAPSGLKPMARQFSASYDPRGAIEQKRRDRIDAKRRTRPPRV